ncbi:hypothetical protein [Methylorubrum extorquens]|jgi:hypothetical protein|uniref:hypothetical protein n=1 Tax=Methylorubrum extorquens TaxID=408 RepID=UPI001EE5811A|nr:hypothetical protein [Methylorubrum extorquens]MCG5248100.1 hypothetical protein [Methylorubrum extorquens]
MSLLRTTITYTSNSTNSSINRPGFKSFKTAEPIVYPSRWHRDFLIQATLDSEIEAIEHAPGEQQDQYSFSIFVFVGGARRLLVGVRDIGDLTNVNFPVGGTAVSRSYVLAEPRCSAARAIWSTRSTLISPSDRVRILSLLMDRAEGVSLGLLASQMTGGDRDPIAVVLALVCAGQAEIDISSPISPETVVRRRLLHPIARRSPEDSPASIRNSV